MRFRRAALLTVVVRRGPQRGYYFGNRIIAEVDVVLPEDMPLKLAHDIGETLQIAIEKLPFVERVRGVRWLVVVSRLCFSQSVLLCTLRRRSCTWTTSGSTPQSTR